MRNFLVAVAVGIGLWLLPTDASADEASLALNPASGPCGTIVQVTGTGFPPNADMLVVGMHNTAVGLKGIEPVAKTDASGAFRVQVQIPSNPLLQCPTFHGMMVFACPLNVIPGCEPKVRALFEVAEVALPSVGASGRSGERRLLYWTALAAVGFIAAAAGIAIRRRS